MDGGDSVMTSLTQSEEDLAQMVAKTDSFWDIGNYKRVVKRYEDGARLCGDFVKMAQERAEIEAKYVKHLQHWSKKWDDLVTKGPEYGSLEVGWKSVLREATKLAEVHVNIYRKIQDEIIDSMNSWKAQNYHKSLMHLKETKKAEDGFLRAQKPWAKRLQKTQRVKKVYHHAAKELEIQNQTLDQAESNPDFSAEQCTKVRDKRDRVRRETDKAYGKYTERLEDLQHYQSRYIEDMQREFKKCQDFEQRRMEFFSASLQSFKDTLDISNNARVQGIYQEYGETLARVSVDDDLRWYSINFGTDMNYNWPEFEEYIPGQTLSKGSHAPSTTSGQNYSPALNGSVRHHKLDHGSVGSSNSSSPALNSTRNQKEEQEYDSAEEWPEPPPPEEPSQDSRSGSEEPQGQLMRALYDYSGSQEDDLNFSEGDLVRIMYKGEDGWAEGLMGDKYGYVPMSYFESI